MSVQRAFRPHHLEHRKVLDEQRQPSDCIADPIPRTFFDPNAFPELHGGQILEAVGHLHRIPVTHPAICVALQHRAHVDIAKIHCRGCNTRWHHLPFAVEEKCRRVFPINNAVRRECLDVLIGLFAELHVFVDRRHLGNSTVTIGTCRACR